MEGMAIRAEAQLARQDCLNSLIERSLQAQDVKQASRKTYEKGLRRFMAWINRVNTV